ncbi:Alpha-aminoadipate--lysW ligase lysX [Candidatus Ornithobacterium hominis]|uniref:Alpha-aminoadipate--lysW ligase lysX n=1 Tax=Candidatus Ornithobacterium hominis TaxID=2497989 RepID=A0A383TW49_9FLAO|nr:30S ribosomal protein S6--L-glutamate ligase [Candidatus Ornithobacterium hominis]MCT7903884.1 30S ribosomal protein S6--L-glutamate ligase [Candidatus Ornithobacterium hominis]CAI9428620.1 30S ribosomal protein S6--L-glutamate ligase [Candidatus Ornithobacterium hominis]SZD71226.1 Alpha-aminoadipate--lysW ligase lysX [Candidatus Ornithobacterium hominis]SZD71903.1 Alpha-aminoadipate--lysW ligase lysX [Candidatus Ornithobacterium hominis]
MKLIILSRSEFIYSTARLLEEAEYRNHDVEVIDPLQCKMVMRKNNPQILVYGEKLEKVDAVLPRIGSTITHYGSAVIRQFEMMNTFTTLGSNALLRSRDKLRTMQLLSREGIDFPRTFYYSSEAGIETEEILELIGGYPIVVKVLEGTQGLGVMLLDSKMAAVSVLEALHSLKAKFLIQEYIKEAKGSDIRIIVAGNKVIATMKREGKEGDFRSNIHRGGMGSQVALSYKEETQALRACRALGLQIAGVDLIRSSRGPLILEVNSSPGLEGIEAATGRNIAEEMIQFIEYQVSKENYRKNKYKG